MRRVVNRINKLKPDIVVFTGDLIDHAAHYKDLYNVSDVLGKIQANIGKYAVYGNHDIGGGSIRYYEEIMNESGFKVLQNENETIEVNDKHISVFGGGDALLGTHNTEETMEGIDEKNINLLLVHEPDLIDNNRKTNLYVSSGLGNTKLPFRFFNIHEIGVFNLKI